ncbi:cytochrome bd oxidase small subunit CydS [Geobacillus jurassicus]|uniref:Type I toxin-antitoxin system Fst family toxin n=1 Tax=Geobacillus jurassicus TaxID=235932 RepID=A0ABV6GU73_9BACL
MQTFLIMYAPLIMVALSVAAAFWAGLKDVRIHD